MPEHDTAAPVVRLGDGVVAVPLAGTLDGARGRAVVETLPQAVVEQGARCAILDVTGVPAVDPPAVRHLLRTVAAVRLTGAECVVCGIRPAVAREVVRLGLDLRTVVTRTTLDDALAYALRRLPSGAGER
ncbi:STAS domain-containing protein [Streptomyces sp. NPDC093260]|uniref:STAS domain-containing protein n=1 Tax=Streptomyces sp. NPDC093260 TaxID=3155073 RepID=UPI0034167D93